MDINLSYSKLSSFDIHGPSVLISKKEIDNDGIRHGSVVDLLIIDKFLNTNLFNDSYIITKFEKPKNNHGILAEDILQRFSDIPKPEVILEIIKGLGLWSSIVKQELLLKKINDANFLGYLKEAFLAKVKTPITLEEYITAKDDATIIISHSSTKEFFTNDDKTKIYLQVPFERKRGKCNYRGIVDLLKIKEIDKETIEVEIVDIKTGTPKHDKFLESFYKYRYYIQSSLYQESIYEILKNIYDITDKKVILKNFKFIYKCKSEDFPIVLDVSEKWIKAGIKGFCKNKIYNYKGINELQSEIEFHLENNLFQYSKEYYLNNGVLKLNDEQIDINDK